MAADSQKLLSRTIGDVSIDVSMVGEGEHTMEKITITRGDQSIEILLEAEDVRAIERAQELALRRIYNELGIDPDE